MVDSGGTFRWNPVPVGFHSPKIDSLAFALFSNRIAEFVKARNGE
jgi:hypothetical protein